MAPFHYSVHLLFHLLALTAAEVKVFTTTWNLGAKQKIDEKYLNEWLFQDENGKDFSEEEEMDIYAIGTQETGHRASVLALPKGDVQNGVKTWKNILTKFFTSKGYEKVSKENRGHIGLFIFAKNQFMKNIKKDEPKTIERNIGFGLGDLKLPNKAIVGTLIEFGIKEPPLLFINMHLPFGGDKEKREEALVLVKEMEKLRMGCIKKEEEELCQSEDNPAVFMLGDMNFRLDNSIAEEIFDYKLIKKNQKNLTPSVEFKNKNGAFLQTTLNSILAVVNIDAEKVKPDAQGEEWIYWKSAWNDKMGELLKADEGIATLEEHNEDEAKPLFGFKERPIKFKPTYRIYQDVPDKNKYSKIRYPAWTDRIFYTDFQEKERSLFDDSNMKYYSKTIGLSDHYPVILRATLSLPANGNASVQ